MILWVRSMWLGILRNLSLLMFARELVVCSPLKSTEGLRYADSTAVIWYHYVNPVLGLPEPPTVIAGWYDVRNKPAPESGTLVHARTFEKEKHGCSPIMNAPRLGTKWISLIQRGECKFQQKVVNAMAANASAVIVYNHIDDSGSFRMEHFVNGIVTVFVHRQDGERLANLTDMGGTNHVNISSATQYSRDQLASWGLTFAVVLPPPEQPPHVARFVVFVVPALIVLLPISIYVIYTYGGRQNSCRFFSFARYQRQEDEPNTDPAL